MESNVLLMTEGISKTFPGVKALSDINMKLRKGEVLGLVGENGAGKSTFIKILMGVYSCDQGKIYIDGEEVNIKTPIDAHDKGLRAVYQDVNLAGHLTVAENFFLGKLPKKLGIVDWNKIYSEAKKAISNLGIDIDVHKKVRHLSAAQQQMVCIAKNVYENAKLIIFDEPTALLTEEETEVLFGIIEKLKRNGISVIYISHRLEELFEVCDRVSILKDGCMVATKNITELDECKIVSMMVGREIDNLYSITSHKQDDVVLEVKGLSREGVFENINFTLHKGEILGISGLVGSGRTEVVRTIFGAERCTSGEIYMNGIKTPMNNPLDAIKHGIALLPENRRTESLALPQSVMFNINLVSYKNNSTFGFVNLKEERELAFNYIKDLRIKTPTMFQKVSKLSGGNQQKVVIAKWLAQNCQILIFDEPTVGIDVGTKQEIYGLLEELTKNGVSIILISSYLPEVIGLSDRILVLHEGRSTGIIDKEDATEEILLKHASGILNK